MRTPALDRPRPEWAVDRERVSIPIQVRGLEVVQGAGIGGARVIWESKLLQMKGLTLAQAFMVLEILADNAPGDLLPLEAGVSYHGPAGTIQVGDVKVISQAPGADVTYYGPGTYPIPVGPPARFPLETTIPGLTQGAKAFLALGTDTGRRLVLNLTGSLWAGRLY